jgi:MFS family permease
MHFLPEFCLLFAFTAAEQLVKNVLGHVVIQTVMTTFFGAATAARNSTLITGTANVLVLVLQPVGGAWSDISAFRSAAGVVRPRVYFTALPAAIAIAALIFMGSVWQFKDHMSPVVAPYLWICLCIVMQVASVLSGASFNALKANLIPEGKRAVGGAIQAVYQTDIC